MYASRLDRKYLLMIEIAKNADTSEDGGSSGQKVERMTFVVTAESPNFEDSV